MAVQYSLLMLGMQLETALITYFMSMPQFQRRLLFGNAAMSLLRIIASLTLSVVFPVTAGERHMSEFTLPSNVHVKIVENLFKGEKLKVVGCNEQSFSCFINSSVPFGVLGEEPSSFVERIEISYKGKSYALDVSNMYNAWGNRPLAKNGVRYFGGACSDTENCVFRGVFSDGAASFAVEWKIVSAHPIRTLLTHSDDVVDLFLKKIDPPTFE